MSLLGKIASTAGFKGSLSTPIQFLETGYLDVRNQKHLLNKVSKMTALHHLGLGNQISSTIESLPDKVRAINTSFASPLFRKTEALKISGLFKNI